MGQGPFTFQKGHYDDDFEEGLRRPNLNVSFQSDSDDDMETILERLIREDYLQNQQRDELVDLDVDPEEIDIFADDERMDDECFDGCKSKIEDNA